LGGYLFDKWTAGAPFYIMAFLNLIALLAAITVILVDRIRLKVQPDEHEEEPLLQGPEIS
jgi:hypothetical protein